MKKALSIIIALLLVATMGMTVFATEPPATYSITIQNPATGHTYTAYQILTGKLSDAYVLSDIVWGDDVTEAGKTALGDAATYAGTLTSNNIDAQAAVLAGYLKENSGTTGAIDGANYVISGLEPGYYLILDTLATDADDTIVDAYSSYIVAVTDNTVAKTKAVTPSMTKKVDDKDDSANTEDETAWWDAADYDIGDAVPFQLNANIPASADLGYYSFYSLTFHDDIINGLDFNAESVVVTVNGTALDASEYSVVTEDLEDGCDFEIVIPNVLAKLRKTGTDNVVTVDYTADLADDALIGSAGNPNKARLEYSNNPNQELDNGNVPSDVDTDFTPWDKVIVFTYQVNVNKVDQAQAALAGAGFTLYKWDAAANDWAEVEYIEPAADKTSFTFTGIDAGTYKLEETVVPDGYNSVDPIEFTVTAEHPDAGDDVAEPTLINLTVNNTAFAVNKTEGDAAFVGSVSTTVTNNIGATLPETGGIGTTIFYVVGGLLMIAAIVVLVAKKRVSAED